MNDYDKASRYAVKMDPLAFLRWLIPGMDLDLEFRGWIDTRTLPFPGDPDRTCDTVARLSFASDPISQWALVGEFQSEPQPDTLDRLLEYVSRLNRELNRNVTPKRRVRVADALVNLTGRRQSSRLEMELPGGAGVGLAFQVAPKTLPEEDAAATLAGIESGAIGRCVLPWIPLMRGAGQRSIIKEWRRLASAEQDRPLRATYGGLARVFADLAGRGSLWRAGLEDWNMRESPTVSEWRDEGRVEGQVEGRAQEKRADVLRAFELRFRESPPERLKDAVNAESDLEKLTRWFEAAVTSTSAREFLSNTGL